MWAEKQTSVLAEFDGQGLVISGTIFVQAPYRYVIPSKMGKNVLQVHEGLDGGIS